MLSFHKLILEFFFRVFRVSEFNTKEFKRQVEKAKTCRELIQVLKVSVSIVDIIVLPEKRGRGCTPESLRWGCKAQT